MTWEIVLGIIALAGFIITIGSLTAKLSGILSRLESSVRELTAAIADVRRENGGEHSEMRRQLDGHENRITILEVKRNAGY